MKTVAGPAGTRKVSTKSVRNGQRFFLLKPQEQQQAAVNQIHVVLNWFEELKQRVPVQ